VLNPDGTMKDPAVLKAVFEAAGVDLSRPVITSCGSGVTAAVLALALERLGHRDWRFMMAAGPNGACTTICRSRPAPRKDATMLEALNPQPQDKILQLIAMFRDDRATTRSTSASASTRTRPA
jgi:hypothetical protein